MTSTVAVTLPMAFFQSLLSKSGDQLAKIKLIKKGKILKFLRQTLVKMAWKKFCIRGMFWGLLGG